MAPQPGPQCQRSPQVLSRTYGPDSADLWLQRWRIFFLACSELFAFDDGREWFVSHVRLARRGGAGT